MCASNRPSNCILSSQSKVCSALNNTQACTMYSIHTNIGDSFCKGLLVLLSVAHSKLLAYIISSPNISRHPLFVSIFATLDSSTACFLTSSSALTRSMNPGVSSCFSDLINKSIYSTSVVGIWLQCYFLQS